MNISESYHYFDSKYKLISMKEYTNKTMLSILFCLQHFFFFLTETVVSLFILGGIWTYATAAIITLHPNLFHVTYRIILMDCKDEWSYPRL